MAESKNKKSESKIDLRDQVDQLQKQLVNAQKMTALGELVSTTTHEFNNVLMTIMNYAKMGLRHDDKETRDKALDKILKASERASTCEVLDLFQVLLDKELTFITRLISLYSEK